MATKLMKGLSASPRDLQYPCWADLKIDGVRCSATLLPSGEVQYLSYAQKPLYNLEPLTSPLMPLLEEYGVVDLEILFDEDFKKTIQWTRSHTRPEGFLERDLVGYILDLPTHPGTLRERYKARERFLASEYSEHLAAPLGKLYESQEALEETLRAVWLRGEEGMMVKDLDSLYKPGGRTKDWLKIKRAETEDGVIMAYNEAIDQKGNPKGELGSLVIQLESGIVCSASSSKLTRADRVALWLIRDTLPGQWAEVRYMQVASAGGARHPVFLRLREAKQ